MENLKILWDGNNYLTTDTLNSYDVDADIVGKYKVDKIIPSIIKLENSGHGITIFE